MLDNLLPSMSKKELLEHFWGLCSYFKAHVNDGLCWNVYSLLKSYYLEYYRRSDIPPLIMTDCPTLVSALKKDGLL